MVQLWGSQAEPAKERAGAVNAASGPLSQDQCWSVAGRRRRTSKGEGGKRSLSTGAEAGLAGGLLRLSCDSL